MNIDIEDCYKKYGPMVFRRCKNMLRNEEEALDAAQDVFVSLLRHQARLHSRFPSSLLYTIATNICLNRLRQRKSRANEDSQNLFLFIDPQFEKVESGMLIDAILQDESESARAICYMYYTDGMTLREIGEVMDLSISAVRKRLLAFSARAKVKLEGEKL